MKSSFCLLLSVILCAGWLCGVEGGAVLELRMLSFLNPREHDWNGHCCDPFCWGQCDNLFTFCLDYTNGNADTESCAYFRKNTGEFAESNNVFFGTNMNGVANPMKKTFGSWPGGYKFKVNVRDDDTGHSGHDDIDRLYLTQTVTPARSSNEASWTSRTLRGVRGGDPTSLNMMYRVYCTADYYGTRCATYCKGRDGTLGHYRCNPNTGAKVCNPGWEDVTTSCMVLSDDCHSSPCQNGATCNDLDRDYSCTCRDGYSGKNCQDEINECASNPCLHGATCVDHVNGYTCTCTHVYVGTHCDNHICNVTSPCNNGGTCYGAGSCHCPPAYAGVTCDVHFCDLNSCENNGTCDVEAGGCFCHAGFVGGLCDVDLCSVTTCENGATCELGTCVCQPGYTGRYCSTDINECMGPPGNETSPCANESPCYDQVDDFLCVCLPGYNGTLCDEKLPEPTSDTFTHTTHSPDVTLNPAEQTRDQTQSNATGGFPIWAVALIAIVAMLIVVVFVVVTIMRKYKRRAKQAEVAAGVRLDADGSYENPVYATDTSMETSENTSVMTRPAADVLPGYMAAASGTDDAFSKHPLPGPSVVPDPYDIPAKLQDNPYSMLSDVTGTKPGLPDAESSVAGPPVPARGPTTSSALDDAPEISTEPYIVPDDKV